MPITSDDLIDIEQHFRVSAGPGAGKTYWLVNHIKNVLHTSKRLGKARKVACITYTNVAVEAILRRLGESSFERVDVSTIHSFLYKHIIKPFISFIAEEFDFKVEKMDGHDDHTVSFSKITQWIKSDFKSLGYLFSDRDLTANHLKNLRWTLDGSDVMLVTKRMGSYSVDKGRRLPFIGNNKQDKFHAYKKLYWSEGTLHHDDVLFFSFELLRRFPFILEVLRAKFPYFFVDEFQDTNPIQAAIVNEIGKEETIVGIIGDKAQSIYSFQGAQPEQFDTFSLPNMIDYVMVDNRRSTNQNIDILNAIRTDIPQTKIRNENGDNPRIIVGHMDVALQRCRQLCGDEVVFSLSRLNITANALKRELNGVIFDRNLDDELQAVDRPSNGNGYRSRRILDCIKAIELAQEKRFKEAIKELEKNFRDIIDKFDRKREVLKFIKTLLQQRDNFENRSLYEFHSFVKAEIFPSISNLAAGATKDFYDDHTYQQVALCIKITEDNSFHRTIHKAKGDEFDNVLLVLNGEEDLEFLLNSNLDDEDHRVNYVAVSRARNRLFINVPTLSTHRRDALVALNFEIE